MEGAPFRALIGTVSSFWGDTGAPGELRVTKEILVGLSDFLTFIHHDFAPPLDTKSNTSTCSINPVCVCVGGGDCDIFFC